jgi:hypothetical protein
VGIQFDLEIIDSRFRGNDNVVMKTHLKKIFELILLTLTINSFLIAQDNNKIDFENCTFKDFPLYGKVQFVESFPDITVQIVQSFPDLKVTFVKSFPDDCGEWQIVESFPDIKIKIVDSFPDLKIKFVDSFPGEP